MKIFLTALFFISIVCISCQSNIPYTEEMKTELKNKSYSDSMETVFNSLIKRNTIVVKNYFKEYGFPGIKENGKKTALIFGCWFSIAMKEFEN